MILIIKEKNYIKNFFLALIGYTLFAIHDGFNKDLVENYEVFQIVFINSFAALITILIYTNYKSAWTKLKNSNIKIQFIKGLLNLLSIFCFVKSLAYFPLVTIYSIVFTAPLLLTIGANLFLKERVGWKRYTAVIVGFIGVIISLDPFNEPLNKNIFLLFFSPFLVSAGWLIIRKYGQRESIFSFLVYGKIYAVIFSGFLLLDHFIFMSMNDIIINFFAGIMRGVGLILVFKSARYLPSSLFAPAQYVQIIAAAIIGYLVFNEIPKINNYIGIFLIVAAGMYIVFREFKLSQTTNKKI